MKKPSQSKVVADPSKKAPAKRSKPKAGPADEVPAKRVKSDARHGGIGGLIDAEEENTNRRAVENLIEAARGNLGLSLAEQEAKVQARKKTSSKSKVEGGGGNEDGHGVPGGWWVVRLCVVELESILIWGVWGACSRCSR